MKKTNIPESSRVENAEDGRILIARPKIHSHRVFLLSAIISALMLTQAVAQQISDSPVWNRTKIYTGGRLCNGLGPADFDGDGFLDYSTNYEDNGNIVLMFHPGAGNTHGKWESVVIGNYPSNESATAADIDGDGWPDIIVAHGHQRADEVSGVVILWHPGNANLARNKDAWTASDDIRGSTELGNYLYVRTGDINGDGALDVISGGRHSGSTGASVSSQIVGVIWHEAPVNKADRRDMTKWKTHDIDGDIISGHGFSLGDLDGDGDLDVALANNDFGTEKTPDTGKYVIYYENPGHNSSSLREEWPRHNLYENKDFYTKPFVAIGDLNGDGKNDIISQLNDRVLYFQNKGGVPAKFERIDIMKPKEAVHRSRPLVFEDVNGDSKMDIVIGIIHHNGSLKTDVPALMWMEYTGETPGPDNWVTHVIKWGDGYPGRGVFHGEKWDILTFADVDGDGDLDLVANCEEYLKINVEWFENPQDPGVRVPGKGQRTAQVLEGADYSKPGKGPVKVFIMAGQSNMEGQGKSIHIKMAAADEKTRAEFSPLMNGEDYAVRKDVWITWGRQRQGELSIGWGSEYGRDGKGKVGPELGFGWHMGELLDEQVLLIKWAAGGHSLKKNFLPPSAGGPLESYTKMVDEVHRVLDNLKTIYPDYDEKLGYEIVGLVWFQAWNDMCDGSQWKEKPHYKSYNERQAALLRDLRKEFKVPNMRMVIGEVGVEGTTHPKHVAFRKAQRAMTLTAEFKKTTRSVETLSFWDPDPRFRSNQGYHYNGNGKIYYFIGKAMALGMFELLSQ